MDVLGDVIGLCPDFYLLKDQANVPSEQAYVSGAGDETISYFLSVSSVRVLRTPPAFDASFGL